MDGPAYTWAPNFDLDVTGAVDDPGLRDIEGGFALLEEWGIALIFGTAAPAGEMGEFGRYRA